MLLCIDTVKHQLSNLNTFSHQLPWQLTAILEFKMAATSARTITRMVEHSVVTPCSPHGRPWQGMVDRKRVYCISASLSKTKNSTQCNRPGLCLYPGQLFLILTSIWPSETRYQCIVKTCHLLYANRRS